jgi:hypothetical protein
MSISANRENFVNRARQIDAALAQETLSPEADRRLRALVNGEGTSSKERSWIPQLALGLAGAAAAALLIFVAMLRTDEAPLKTLRIAGLTVVSGQVRADGNGVRCLSKECILKGNSTELILDQATLIGRRDEHFEVKAGHVRFDVERRPSPLRVFVSEGFIEVLGTRFQIWQEEERGRVSLEEGRIRYAAGKRNRVLSPGDTLHWPLVRKAEAPPTTAPTTVPSGESSPVIPRGTKRVLAKRLRAVTKPKARKLTAKDAESLLQRVERLRSQTRFAEAITLIRSNLPRIGDRTNSERFSYELGALMANHGASHDDGPKRACGHFSKHLRRFGSGRYGAEIRGIRKRLKCRTGGQ